ncbi:MAG: DUF885 domain-containing protein [Gemmatimonadetes bacterium]|nr:DUF885 domain-containing protein [Gemmatimonadota bacterium]
MKWRAAWILLIGAAGGLGCTVRQTSGATESFRALMAEWWAFELAVDPIRATGVGEHRHDALLPFVNPDSLAGYTARRQAFAARLEGIPVDQLSPDDRVSHAMIAAELDEAIKEFQFGSYRIPILVDDGFHIGFARQPFQFRFASLADYRNFLGRLASYPRYNRENIANLRRGLETGFTMPRVVLEGYESTIAAHAVDSVDRSVFWNPFARFPNAVPADSHPVLRAQARQVISDSVVPAYREFLRFMVEEYRPNARTTIGASEWPDGAKYYDWLVTKFTTLPLTADSVHRLGLAEVARIRGEMDRVIGETGFRGSFSSFLGFLRTDPRFYPKSGDELLSFASRLAKLADAKLPAYFGLLPRQPYGVEPVPDDLAPKYTAGRYVGAPLDGPRAGTYWVNLYGLPSRPLYALPALTLHEAVPGHHLQSALAKELEGLPPFRRFGYVNAFGEGWGLYSEYLGVEMGMYRTPYEHFGRLTYEMWRACRLVVDTGLHAKGWSRDQAREFLAGNTALSLHEIRTETDRYISWPGQALAYKLGELKIRELRLQAERAMGSRFDLRSFHDVVLGSGSVPLTVLADQVNGYIAGR